VSNALIEDQLHRHARVGTGEDRREGLIIAQVRFAAEIGRRIGRVVHLDPVDVHEERLAALGVLLM
jgi:hypothetical protein